LPAITSDKQLGLTINFVKSSTTTNQYTVTLYGNNQYILTSTQYASGQTSTYFNSTLLGNSAAMTTLIIAKTSAGAYFWAELSNATKAADNAATTYLSKADASTTYLSKADASTTYLSKADASTTYVNVSGSSLQTITGQKKFTGGITFDTVQPKSIVGYSTEGISSYNTYYRVGTTPVTGEVSQYTIGFTYIQESTGQVAANISNGSSYQNNLLTYTITLKGIYMINWHVRVAMNTTSGASRSLSLVCFGLNLVAPINSTNPPQGGLKIGTFLVPGSYYLQDAHDYYYRIRSNTDIFTYLNTHSFSCIYIHNVNSSLDIKIGAYFESPLGTNTLINEIYLYSGISITRIA